MPARYYEGKNKDNEIAVGIMSGTSLDGIDVIIVDLNWKKSNKSEQTDQSGWLNFQLELEKIYFASLPYKEDIAKDLEHITNEPEVNLAEIVDLDRRLGEAYALAVNKVLVEADIASSRIAFVGCHGQTVFHRAGASGAGRLDKGSRGDHTLSLQLGSAAVLAERTGITTVTNFRQRDIAAGGEGAPLVPVFDYLFYANFTKHRILINIGGIANYTIIPAGGSCQDVRGSDTGPGNMMLDAAVKIITGGERKFDKNGEMAASGTVQQAGLDFLLQHGFFNRELPRSTGRAEFGEHFVRKYMKFCRKNSFADSDIIATLTEFTVQTIADTLLLDLNEMSTSSEHFQEPRIMEIFVSGGGSFNRELMRRLASTMKNKLKRVGQMRRVETEVLNSKTAAENKLPLISAEEKEAAAFAVLAWLTLKNKPGNLPQITGASKPVVLGEVNPGPKFFYISDS